MLTAIMRIGAVGIVFLPFLNSTLRADWQFTRWGMSVDELLKVRPGLIKLTDTETKKQSVGSGAFGWGQYRGPYDASGMPMSIMFYFRNGGLSAVRLTADRPKEDNSRIYSLLERTYGSPITSKSELDRQQICLDRFAEWKDEKGQNIVRYGGYSCIDIPHLKIKGLHAATILYLPLATSNDSGL